MQLTQEATATLGNEGAEREQSVKRSWKNKYPAFSSSGSLIFCQSLILAKFNEKPTRKAQVRQSLEVNFFWGTRQSRERGRADLEGKIKSIQYWMYKKENLGVKTWSATLVTKSQSTFLRRCSPL